MSGSDDGARTQPWQAIQKWVCSVCLDQGPDGQCGLRDRTCAVRTHLSTLVQTIATIDSRRMDEYFDAVEARICSHCVHHRPEADPDCALRQRGECALYSYLPLVVDALQEAAATMAPSAGDGSTPAAPVESGA